MHFLLSRELLIGNTRNGHKFLHCYHYSRYT
jgi:hypothetical protein